MQTRARRSGLCQMVQRKCFVRRITPAIPAFLGRIYPMQPAPTLQHAPRNHKSTASVSKSRIQTATPRNPQQSRKSAWVARFAMRCPQIRTQQQTAIPGRRERSASVRLVDRVRRLRLRRRIPQAKTLIGRGRLPITEPRRRLIFMARRIRTQRGRLIRTRGNARRAQRTPAASVSAQRRRTGTGRTATGTRATTAQKTAYVIPRPRTIPTATTVIERRNLEPAGKLNRHVPATRLTARSCTRPGPRAVH